MFEQGFSCRYEAFSETGFVISWLTNEIAQYFQAFYIYLFIKKKVII